MRKKIILTSQINFWKSLSFPKLDSPPINNYLTIFPRCHTTFVLQFYQTSTRHYQLWLYFMIFYVSHKPKWKYINLLPTSWAKLPQTASRTEQQHDFFSPYPCLKRVISSTIFQYNFPVQNPTHLSVLQEDTWFNYCNNLY